MKNTILIIGKPESGKTYLAKNTALLFNSVCWVNGRKKELLEHPFSFAHTNKDTDLLIFDDVSSIDQIQEIVYSSEIKIQKHGVKGFTIKRPLTIITTDIDLPKEFFWQKSISRRCSFIKAEVASNGIFNYSKLLE